MGLLVLVIWFCLLRIGFLIDCLEDSPPAMLTYDRRIFYPGFPVCVWYVSNFCFVRIPDPTKSGGAGS